MRALISRCRVGRDDLRSIGTPARIQILSVSLSENRTPAVEVDKATAKTVISLVESEFGVEFDRQVPKSIITNSHEWAV